MGDPKMPLIPPNFRVAPKARPTPRRRLPVASGKPPR
jgi:hypothetical protein